MKRFAAAAISLAVFLAIAVWMTDRTATIPTGNTQATHFDAILVLGWPANTDGTPSEMQRARVMEAVREFRAGRSEHMILSGGAAHNRWVEGLVMAQTAKQAGVPGEAIEVEGQALNTVQNIFYSHQIMQRRGWTSAEVVSSANHLPRAALILQHYKFAWQTHAAPWPPQYGPVRIAAYTAYEASHRALIRWFGFARTPYLPR